MLGGIFYLLWIPRMTLIQEMKRSAFFTMTISGILSTGLNSDQSISSCVLVQLAAFQS